VSARAHRSGGSADNDLADPRKPPARRKRHIGQWGEIAGSNAIRQGVAQEPQAASSLRSGGRGSVENTTLRMARNASAGDPENHTSRLMFRTCENNYNPASFASAAAEIRGWILRLSGF
jgi:hypothetical protein